MSLENGIIKGAIYLKESVYLRIIENPTNNSVRCKCGVCGAEEGYKVSDMSSNKIRACKTCANGIKIGEEINNAFVVEALFYRNPIGLKKVMPNISTEKLLFADIKCKNCGKMYAKSTLDIKNNKILKCKCTASTSKVDNTIKNKEENKVKKVDTKKNLSGYITSIEDTRRSMIEYEKRGDFIRTGMNSIRSKTGQSISSEIKGTCIKCAGISKFKVNEWNTGDCKCKKCNTLGDNSKNIIKNINWVGHTVRNLKITKTTTGSDGVIKAEVQCLLCGTTYTFNLVSVLNEPELLCMACADTKITINCLECGYPSIKTTQRALYKNREEQMLLLCRNCNNAINAAELRHKHETETKFNNIRKQYKGLTLDKYISGREGTANLFTFKEGYTGRDGKEYNTCMCEEHHKFLILNTDEILHYKHEFCADTRMQAYKPKKKQ